jgi:hypothetical protein
MPIEWGLIQSAISAGAGLAGVWLGGRLTWQREEARERERNKKEMSYLAILVVAHLDRFANGCLYVAQDDGTDEGRPAGDDGVSHEETVKPPTIDPLALDVNWKVLPAELMYGILNLPYRKEQLVRQIWGERHPSDYPDYTDYFWARQYAFAEFGLEVSVVARRLCEHAGLPAAPSEPGAGNLDDLLREQKDRVTKQRQARAAKIAARQPNVSSD